MKKGYFTKHRLNLLLLVIFISIILFLFLRNNKKELFTNNNYFLKYDEAKYKNLTLKQDIKHNIIKSDCDLVDVTKLNELNNKATVVNSYPYSFDQNFIFLRYSYSIEQKTSKIVQGESKKVLYVFRVIDTNNKLSLNYTQLSIPKTGKKGCLVIHLDKIGTFLYFTKIHFYGTTSFIYLDDFPKELQCVNGFYQFYFSFKPDNYQDTFSGFYKVVSLENFNNGYKKLSDKQIIYENCSHMINYKSPHDFQAILPQNIKVFKDCLNIVKNKENKPKGDINWCLDGLENCYTKFKGNKTSQDTCYMPDLNMNISPFCNPYINSCENPDFIIEDRPYYWRNYGKNDKCFGKTTYIDERQPIISSKQFKEPIDIEENNDFKYYCGSGKGSKKLKYNQSGSIHDYSGFSIPVESNILNCFVCEKRTNDKKFFDVRGTHIKFVGDQPPANNKIYNTECPGSSRLYGPNAVKCDSYLLSPN